MAYEPSCRLEEAVLVAGETWLRGAQTSRPQHEHEHRLGSIRPWHSRRAGAYLEGRALARCLQPPVMTRVASPRAYGPPWLDAGAALTHPRVWLLKKEIYYSGVRGFCGGPISMLLDRPGQAPVILIRPAHAAERRRPIFVGQLCWWGAGTASPSFPHDIRPRPLLPRKDRRRSSSPFVYIGYMHCTGVFCLGSILSQVVSEIPIHLLSLLFPLFWVSWTRILLLKQTRLTTHTPLTYIPASSNPPCVERLGPRNPDHACFPLPRHNHSSSRWGAIRYTRRSNSGLRCSAKASLIPALGTSPDRHIAGGDFPS